MFRSIRCPLPHFRCQLQDQVVTCTHDYLAVNQRFPQSPPWVWLYFVRAAHRTQRNILLTRAPIIIKGHNSGATWWEAGMEQGVGSGQRWSTLFPGAAPPPPFPSVHQLESCEPLPSWIFMGASLRRKDWLDHWPLETALGLQPLSSPGGQGSGLEVPALWSLSWLCWPSAPTFGTFPKSSH